MAAAPTLVLLVGSASCGKSSLAEALLAAGQVAGVVNCDTHRYVPGTAWVKHTTEEYVARVESAIACAQAAHPGQRIAVDTTVYDRSDPEDARGQCARRLCASGRVWAALYLHMDHPRLLRGLLTRSLRRAKGVELQNPAAAETPSSVARLVEKHACFSQDTLPKTLEFLEEARLGGVRVLQAEAVHLPEPWDTPAERSPWTADVVAAIVRDMFGVPEPEPETV
jgi:hypothetical protein